MNKSFDKILVRRIREVFDDHREPVAREAWKDMERKLDAGNNLRIVYMHRISRIAAALILLFLVFWPFNQRVRENIETGDHIVLQSQQSPPVPQDTEENRDNQSPSVMSTRKPDNKTQKPAESQRQTSMLALRNQGNSIKAETSDKKDLSPKKPNNLRIRNDLQKMQPLHRGISEVNERERLLLAVATNDASKSTWDKLSPPSPKETTKRQVNLGVALSTLYNYAPKATESELNFSAGVLSEFKLLPNLSMNTGMIVSREYFTTQNGHSLVFSNGQSIVSEILIGAEMNYSSAKVLSNSRKVELVGLDVPVNLQYRYKDFSLTAGISSIAYIQEQYSYHYSIEYTQFVYDNDNSLTATNKVTRSKSIEESYKPLQQIDLANILNLSLGYHFTFDRSQLVVEPFMKHPLGELTSQDIRFGARGIRLKYQF